MENKDLSSELQKLSKDLEAQRHTLSSVISILSGLSSAVNDGFAEVNERLAILEGKQGMQGVNTQLKDIKNELIKIQKAYPYEDMFNNIQSVQGEA